MAQDRAIIEVVPSGHATPIDKRKELFHVAYMRALCAINGYALNIYDFDYDSVDCTVRSFEGRRVSLDVQLKATSQNLAVGDHIAFPLPMKNYRDLIDENRDAPAVLAVLLLGGPEPQHWHEDGVHGLLLRAKMYYRNIMGCPEVDNKETRTVEVPFSNCINPVTLRNIMTHLDATGEVP